MALRVGKYLGFFKLLGCVLLTQWGLHSAKSSYSARAFSCTTELLLPRLSVPPTLSPNPLWRIEEPPKIVGGPTERRRKESPYANGTTSLDATRCFKTACFSAYRKLSLLKYRFSVVSQFNLWISKPEPWCSSEQTRGIFTLWVAISDPLPKARAWLLKS